MAGSNPFIQPSEVTLPTSKYTIRFMPHDVAVEVDPNRLPYSREGLKGSILEIALGNDLDIDHACGGVCACSTCHVIIREGGETCQEPTDDELDQLDLAPGQEAESRLACQAVPNGSCDLVVEIPNWNRNAVSEDH